MDNKDLDQASQAEQSTQSGLVTEQSTKGAGQPISRRDLLKMAGVGGIGLLLGSVGVSGVLAASGKLAESAPQNEQQGSYEASIPFYAEHQAGIVTPAQDFLCFASFDLTTERVSEVADLLRMWTDAAAVMSTGKLVGLDNTNVNLPPPDTGESDGLSPSRITFTFGAGPALFDQRFGLAAKRPAALADLPAFAADNLRPEWCGGDLAVQVCANDMQVAFHAIRNLARIARGFAVLRWTQEGFQRSSRPDVDKQTPRNLLGFKDGTGNPNIKDAGLMNQVVWVQPADGPEWMVGGSYMVVRRIRLRIEVWDRSTLGDQEATFGRHRQSGALLGSTHEFEQAKLDRLDADGKSVIPETAHVRLAAGDGTEKILRRSYSFSNGMDLKTGQLDAGLFFISYQKDIGKQFTPIQLRLSKADKLNEYMFHMGSAIFACFPGAQQGRYIGEELFA